MCRVKARTVAACLLSFVPLSAAQDELVIRAQTLYTVTGRVLAPGEVLVKAGKIAAVGERVEASVDARVLTAHSVTPGFIDTHTHAALDRSSRPEGPVTAEWRAVDHLDLDDPMLPLALKGGLTTIVTRPGSAIVSSGQGVAIKLRESSGKPKVLEDFVDLKMAVRPLINLRPEDEPATVMGWYAIADDYFRRARDYLERDGKGDARLDAFAAVLRGEVMVHAHSHYPSEVQMVLQLARRYGFIDRLALAHVEEAFPIADLLAETSVVSVVGPVMIVRYYGDERTHNVVKELMEAGALASVQTDQSGEHLRDYREYGAFLVRHGLSETHALEALTINGAKALMLDERIGSIAVGKDADLVLFDGHPFDLTADRVERVLVDGVIEYEREREREAGNAPALTPVGPFTPLSTPAPRGPSFTLVNAHAFPVSAAPVENATIVVRNGKIAAVGRGGDVDVDPVRDGPVVDVGGRVVSPGWISARAYPNDWIGDLKWQLQNDEITRPITPEMNARFAVDPWFPSFDVIREVGITTQHITPGHKNIAGGNGVVVKNLGMDLDVMVRKEPSSSAFSLLNENGAAAEPIRELLNRARDYLAAPSASRTYDAGLEALAPVLERKVPAIVHARTEDEIRNAIAIADEFELKLLVSGAVQAYRVADELASRDIGVILGDTESRLEDVRGGGDGYNVRSPALLTQRGVKVAFFGPSGSRRGMPTGRLGGEPALNAAWAFRNGVAEQDALKMFTLNAAEMIGMGESLGSIEPGKDADLLVFEGHPFDYRTLPLLVYIDGELAHRVQK
jgi:imidazolonepropionase-like amidohydrolase